MGALGYYGVSKCLANKEEAELKAKREAARRRFEAALLAEQQSKLGSALDKFIDTCQEKLPMEKTAVIGTYLGLLSTAALAAGVSAFLNGYKNNSHKVQLKALEQTRLRRLAKQHEENLALVSRPVSQKEVQRLLSEELPELVKKSGWSFPQRREKTAIGIPSQFLPIAAKATGQSLDEILTALGRSSKNVQQLLPGFTKGMVGNSGRAVGSGLDDVLSGADNAVLSQADDVALPSARIPKWWEDAWWDQLYARQGGRLGAVTTPLRNWSAENPRWRGTLLTGAGLAALGPEIPNIGTLTYGQNPYSISTALGDRYNWLRGREPRFDSTGRVKGYHFDPIPEVTPKTNGTISVTPDSNNAKPGVMLPDFGGKSIDPVLERQRNGMG
jgi:hypothetical protein